MLGSVFLALALTSPAPNSGEVPVPLYMQGIWAKHGRCDVLADRLTIAGNLAGWGKKRMRRIRYDDQLRAVFWDEEYVVDNFVIGPNHEVLIHNTQGFGMPGEEGYGRCLHGNVREPWPSLVSESQPDQFAYKFEMTREESPVEPAVERRYSAVFGVCQKSAVTTHENEGCFIKEFARQDRKLNQVWRATLKRLVPNKRPLLVTAQRQWVSRRDPFCRSKAKEFTGGTIAPVIYVSCRVEQTIRRTIWLEALR